MKNGSETMLCVPEDDAYQITIKRGKSPALTYYDEVQSPLKLMPDPGKIYIVTSQDTEYKLNLLPGEGLPQLTRADGSLMNAPSTAFDASPVNVMKNELNSIKGSYLTLGEALKIVLIVWLGINLLLLVCLFMFINHRRNLRGGHLSYSDWYVIVPHLLLIATFIALTAFTP